MLNGLFLRVAKTVSDHFHGSDYERLAKSQQRDRQRLIEQGEDPEKSLFFQRRERQLQAMEEAHAPRPR